MHCKNCKYHLNESNNFCSNCGAKVIINRLTFKNLWRDFYEKFFNIDNLFLTTYIHLFTTPQSVIGGYIEGVRKKYLDVFKYFALAVTLSGIQLFIIRKFFPESMDVSMFINKYSPEDAFNMDWMYDYYSLVVLVNLPIYALIAFIVFYTLKKLNYTEHLVTMTYVTSQFSITSAILLTPFVMLGANFYLLGSVANLFLIIYTAYCYKKVLNLSTEGIILRTLLFFGIALIFLLIQGIIQAYFMYKSGVFDEIINNAKNAKKVSYTLTSFINWTS